MTTAYTSLLGLALPVDGELTGTWGQTVNNYITTYLDGAVAGTQIISGSLTAVTLSKTTGASLSQAGTGATGSSQYQIIRCTGNPASLLTITAPAADKTYVVINATSTSQSVKIVGVGPTPTGVTILSGKTSLVAWNGTDFVEITPATATTATAANGLNSATTTVVVNGATAPTTGQVLTATSGSAATWQTPSTSAGTVTSVAALTLGTTGTDVSSTVANGTTTPVITLNLPTASATNRGALSSTDWSAFNGKLSTTGGTMTGLLTAKELALTKTAPSISAGVLTLDCSLSNTFAVSLNAAITSFTVSNIPTSGSYYEFNLEFTADGTARSVTWTFSSVAVKWPGGTAPTLTSTNGKKDTFVFYTYDAGTTWLGFVAGQNL